MWTELLIAGQREFFVGLGDKYRLDLQDFLHDKLEHLLGVALLFWILTRLLKLITGRILRVASRQSNTAGHLAQVTTLTSVIRATGLAIIVVLAALRE